MIRTKTKRSAEELEFQRVCGFARVELLFCIVALLLLVLLIVPTLANTRNRSQLAGCVDNLRLIGQAVQLWGLNHEYNPWIVAVGDGGTKPGPANGAFSGFQFLSNQLVTPKIIVCPGDSKRTRNVADNWTTSTNGGYLNSRYRNNATSYTLSYHTFLSEPNSLLSSDRNLRVDNGGITLCNYTGLRYTPGAEILAGPQPTRTSWTNDVHGLTGNVLTTDGHVSQTSTASLQTYLRTLKVSASDSSAIHVLFP
jgi:prepilin-type processing-associated H-X9-DG protein